MVCRIGGGLGNQLFIYAAAQSLAWRSGAALWFDTRAFQRDIVYRRQWLLPAFVGPANVPTLPRSGPLAWKLRGLTIRAGALMPTPLVSSYMEPKPARFLRAKVRSRAWRTYLVGFWQSEKYFAEYRKELLSALALRCPLDELTSRVAAQIEDEPDSVAVHLRSYSDVNIPAARRLVPIDYTILCCQTIAAARPHARFFLFADDPSRFRDVAAGLPRSLWIEHSHARGNEGAIDDLYLMSRCKHFVTANSTLSCWAAWLSQQRWGVHELASEQRFIFSPGAYMFNEDAVPSWWIDPTRKTVTS